MGWRPAPDLNIYPNPVSRGGAGQVDSWEIPASLAAGIYVLWVVRQGSPVAVCTREIMVR